MIRLLFFQFFIGFPSVPRFVQKPPVSLVNFENAAVALWLEIHLGRQDRPRGAAHANGSSARFPK
jgi:hypothetical protein